MALNNDLRAIGFSEVRGRITGNRLEVYSRLLAHGPATGSELAAVMGWEVTSVRPRLTELCDLHHATATGKRRMCEHEFAALSTTAAEAMHEAATRRAAPAPEPTPEPPPPPPPGRIATEIARHAKEMQLGFFL